jgi:hypothetical protein
MSLKRFVQRPHVRAELSYFRPSGPHLIPAPIRVPPGNGNRQRLGAAFDYLLRFELGRRVRDAVEGPWVAERAAAGVGFELRDLDQFESAKALLAHQQRQERQVNRVLRDGKRAISAYRRKRRSSSRDRAELAGYALRFASLDEVCRSGTRAPDFNAAPNEQIAELLELLSLVPFDALCNARPLLLNPTFREASRVVGGADADLICGDTLIDVKTVNEKSVQADYFDQLLGYFILARHARRFDTSFPIINHLALYFARQGHLWKTWDVSALHDDAEFLTLEQWFIDEAEGRHANGTACDMCPTPGEGRNCARCFALDLPKLPQLVDPR